MKNGQPMQSFTRIKLREVATGGFHEWNEGGVDHRHQDLFFVFEVEINGAVGDVGAGGDIRDVGGKVSVASKDGNGSLKNAISFFAAASGLIDRVPGDVAAAFAARWSGSRFGHKRMNRNSAMPYFNFHHPSCAMRIRKQVISSTLIDQPTEV